MVGRKAKDLDLKRLSDAEQGYIIGFFIGDGYCYYSKKDRHYMVEFHFNSIRDEKIYSHVRVILEKLGTRYFEHIDKRFNSLRIRVNSKILYNFVKLKLKEFNRSKFISKDYKIGVISGFIDADGYVTKGTIQLTQKNKRILWKFIRLCESFEIPHRKVWSHKNFRTENLVWHVHISTKFKGLKHCSHKVKTVYSGVEHGL